MGKKNNLNHTQKKTGNHNLKLKAFSEGLWEKIWKEGEQVGKGSKDWLFNSIRVITKSSLKFLDDDVLIWASSICYSLIISFVPMLIVAMLIGARFIDIEWWFSFAEQFLRDKNIPLDPSPIFELIRHFLQNTTAVGGVGLMVLLFSATALLRNLEGALNKIWGIKASRPILQKITGFVMVMIFSPIVIATGFSLARNLVSHFSAPDLIKFNHSGSKNFLLGSKNYLGQQSNSTGKFFDSNLTARVDFSYNNKVFVFDRKNKLPISDETYLQYEKNFKLKKPDHSFLKESTLSDMAVRQPGALIVTDTGLLLHSQNDGESYYVQSFQTISERSGSNELYPLRLKSVLSLGTKKWLIAGSQGTLLYTKDAGKNWNWINIPDSSSNFKGLHRTSSGDILLLSDKELWTSSDAEDWRLLSYELQLSNDSKLKWNDLDSYGSLIVMVGNRGKFIIYDQRTDSLALKQFDSNLDLVSVRIISDQKIILITRQGDLRVTLDGAKTWKRSLAEGSGNYNDIGYDPQEKALYIVGNNNQILKSEQGSLANFTLTKEYTFQTILANLLGNFILPFLVIWFFFFLIYKIIPYINVSNLASAVGAAVTSAVWVIFLFGFRFYLSSFSKGTFALYGSLAAVPLVLLGFYASIVIMLFGAEISFFIQNKNYHFAKLNTSNKQASNPFWNAIHILKILFESTAKSLGSVDEQKFLKILRIDKASLLESLHQLKKAGYIDLTSDNNWLPSVDSKNIFLSDLWNALGTQNLSVPKHSSKDLFSNHLGTYFKNMKKNQLQVFSKHTLFDLLQKTK